MQPLFAQSPVTLAPDGTWTWFNDPRAVIKDGLLYFGYMQSNGRSTLGVYNLQNPAAPTTLWTSTWTEIDDHDNPGLLPLQDGRLMGFYARHATASTSFNYRLSSGTTPAIPANWSGELTYNSPERVSYANPFQLTAESGRVYNFMRNLNYNPTFVSTDDFGASWSDAKILIQTGSGGTVRPYVKYASNGTDRIDFFYSDGHPRDLNNSLYHAYYKDGALYKTDGTFLKTLANAPLLHDSGERGSVIYQYSAAASIDPNNHIATGRAWCWDLAYDASGHPIATFSVQVDNVAGPNWSDDRIYYFYARWVPGSGWQKRFIAQAGRPLYQNEDDYAGGICVDPRDPNVIYISSNAASPFDLSSTTKVPLKGNGRYEIYRGVTADGGLTFTWQAITPDSAVDNLRPYVPRDRTDYSYALIWFAGTYTSYTSWATQVKALFTNEINQPPGVSIVSPVGGSAVLQNLGSNLLLQANVSDDGEQGALSVQWSVVSGPPGAVFDNATSAETGVTFFATGQYRLRITASDGAKSTSVDVTVSVGTGSLTASSTLWLKLNEAGGNEAADSSSAGNAGTLSGGTTWQPTGGSVGGSLSFDGTSGFVEVPNSSSLQPGNAFTLSYWFRAHSYNSAGAGLISKRTAPTDNNAFTTFLQGNTSDAAYKRINVDIDGNNDRFTSNTQIQLNTWYHVALVFDGSLPAAERATLYVNGVIDKTAAESSASVPNYASSLKVGVTHLSATTWLDGSVDEVRFFQRALTGNEVGSLAGALNLAPVVSVGPAPSPANGVAANLEGSASDDGKGGSLSTFWSKIGGPGAVVFGNPASPSTTALFDRPGAYVLRLFASDTQIGTFSDLSVTVSPNPDNYADWISSSYPGEHSPQTIGPDADPEKDGVSNILEFSLGMNPASVDAVPAGPGRPGLPTISILSQAGSDYLGLQVCRPISRVGLTYGARVSGNLIDWSDGLPMGYPTPNGDGTETWLFRDTVPFGNAQPRFIRLQILYSQ